MAEKISVEIGLDGGQEVERQLEDIGKAGQKAFSDIQGAAEQVNLDSTTAQFDDLGSAGQAAFQKVQAAAQNAAAFEQVVQGVRKVEGAFESLGNAVAKIGTRMTRSLGVLGVAARALGPLGIALGVVGGAFVKFGDDAADALNKLNVAGAKLGQTPQQFDQLQKALANLGVSADAIGPGLEKFRATLGEDWTGNFTAAFGQFIAQLERMPDSVERTQLAITKLGDAFGGQVIAGLQAGTLNAQNYATALGQVKPATQAQILAAQQYQIALNQLNAAWTELKAAFVPITTPIFSLLTEELKNLTTDIGTIRLELQLLKSAWDVFVAGISGQDVGAAARKAAEDYKLLEEQIRRTGQAAASIGDGFAKVDQPEGLRGLGFAGGGMIGGRGTGTSDSNLAWVSRGEHIMPARAVAQPGVLSFLEALRRTGGNLRGVLDGMGRFALGGLVPRLPAFADGGPVGGMANVTIQFPGLQPIGGLRASAEVVDELRKAAALAQVRSGGRKPSRYS